MDKIAIGSDHAGYRLKEEIKKKYELSGLFDFGAHTEESCDYPVFGLAVAEAVASGEFAKGIVICGTGIGISIAANKVPGIRAALCGDVYSAKMARSHNDANVLALGQRVIGNGLAIEIADIWLNTDFEGGRHQARVDKITRIESY